MFYMLLGIVHMRRIFGIKSSPLINLDAYLIVIFSSGYSRICRVIRDGKRNWILGYNRFLGKCSVIITESKAYWMAYFYFRNKNTMRSSSNWIISRSSYLLVIARLKDQMPL
ncbi:hypothetical protein PVK06_028267 [Gossypium arboreum]|uniref:Uncharacterized protein n=1 Tax=Gossypium arboreum TaxID=29729 RepID=A0ABR0P2H7_GOSAR|nr:hypothetical protein PVK06_028267 [Gossypium arboreum]